MCRKADGRAGRRPAPCPPRAFAFALGECWPPGPACALLPLSASASSTGWCALGLGFCRTLPEVLFSRDTFTYSCCCCGACAAGLSSAVPSFVLCLDGAPLPPEPSPSPPPFSANPAPCSAPAAAAEAPTSTVAFVPLPLLPPAAPLSAAEGAPAEHPKPAHGRQVMADNADKRCCACLACRHVPEHTLRPSPPTGSSAPLLCPSVLLCIAHLHLCLQHSQRTPPRRRSQQKYFICPTLQHVQHTDTLTRHTESPHAHGTSNHHNHQKKQLHPLPCPAHLRHRPQHGCG